MKTRPTKVALRALRLLNKARARGNAESIRVAEALVSSIDVAHGYKRTAAKVEVMQPGEHYAHVGFRFRMRRRAAAA